MSRMNFMIALLSAALGLMAADDVVSAIHGTVQKVDAGAKTVAVKTADGTVYTVHVAEKTVMHGVDGGKAGLNALANGTEVVVHGTKKGTAVTATELGRIGKGGVEVTEATVKTVGKGGKAVVVTTAKGGEETYQVTSKAAEETSKGVKEGTKVVVYSTQKAGKKIAHFFEAK